MKDQFQSGGVTMTELRKRMIECLQLRGLSARTQESYVRAVRQLSEHYHKSPDLITDEDSCAPRQRREGSLCATATAHAGVVARLLEDASPSGAALSR